MKFFLPLVLGLLLCGELAAQKNVLYTDYKPQYRAWKSNYILDKITYTKTETIFYFRYASIGSKAGFVNTITLYGNENPYAWVLENVKTAQMSYRHSYISNVRVNSISFKNYVPNSGAFQYKTSASVIITCEVHFPRLPVNVTEVHFLEGPSQRSNPNHFHCFNVRLKPFKDKDLGTEADMAANIRKFEMRNMGEVISKLPEIKKEKVENPPQKQETAIVQKPRYKESQAQIYEGP